MYWAANRGHSTIVELLVDSGAQLDVLDNDGATPMMIAALSGNTDCVKTIQQAGGDMEIQSTATGATALIMASQEGHQDIVEMLVRGGTRMDTYSNYGYCPLHKAAQRWSGFWSGSGVILTW